jgi:tRNA U55 pseudouridine synthase TruB
VPSSSDQHGDGAKNEHVGKKSGPMRQQRRHERPQQYGRKGAPSSEPECPFNGFVIVNKPIHVTSNDVVGKIRTKLGKLAYGPHWRMGKRSPKLKIGHGGTLDPLATGILGACFAGTDRRY